MKAYGVQPISFAVQVQSWATGWTLRHLAGKVGLSRATLSRVARGRAPSLRVFLVICKQLRMDPMLFVDEFTARHTRRTTKRGRKQ